MPFSIRGKTAIVTGAAHGVGLAIARHFVEQGARVVMVDMDEEALDREAGQIAGEDKSARLFAGDLRQRLTITNLLSLTVEAFDRIDILVNASRQVMLTDPLDPEDNSVEELLEQNLMTALRLSQATAKRMIRQADSDDASEGPVGSIVNISSIAARRTRPDLLAYSVSAAASDQMTRSLAVALAPKRIRVNAVAYGSVMSGHLRGILRQDDGLRQEIVTHTPLGRIASPAEVTDAVQYLASTLIDPAGVSAH
jgi:7-alpha-hydroxysteroid dehydrogenase